MKKRIQLDNHRAVEIMRAKLKPCPFCGARKKDEAGELHIYFLWHEKEYIVECDKCGANTGLYRRKTKEAAIEAWNRRASDER